MHEQLSEVKTPRGYAAFAAMAICAGVALWEIPWGFRLGVGRVLLFLAIAVFLSAAAHILKGRSDG